MKVDSSKRGIEMRLWNDRFCCQMQEIFYHNHLESVLNTQNYKRALLADVVLFPAGM
jgi:hypothetical protein